MIRVWQKPVFLLCISLLVFANTLGHPFVHDDIVFIVQNPSIGRFDDLPQFFFKPNPNAVINVNTYYRPLLEVLYRVEHAVYGLNPVGWHLFNVVLHGINGILVQWLLLLMGIPIPVAFVSALIFIVHPVQSEAVACVAGVSNLLMAFWVLLTLIAYWKKRWWLSGICLVLGLLTKEQTIMVLPLIVILDWYRGKKNFKSWVLFTAGAFIFLYIRQVLTGAHLMTDLLASPHELQLRFLSIAQTLAMYVRVLLLPFDLHYYRSTDILTVNWWWWPILAVALFYIFKAERLIRLGALWFIAALCPVLNILPLINEYSLILTSEHFLYLPMIGVVIMGGFLVKDFEFKRNDKLTGIIIAVVIILSLITVRQNMFWQSELVLFERTMAFEPKFGRGHLLLAKAYYFKKDYELANTHFAKAYQIMRTYQAKVASPSSKQFYLGFIKSILFDWAHSLEDTGVLSAAKAKYVEATAIDPQDPILWNNLGVLSIKMGDHVLAKTYFEQALTVSPDFSPAKSNLSHL